MRLLSHRPSVLFKIEHHATESGDDPAVDGVVISGPGWDERLRDALAGLSEAERDGLFAVRLGDEQGLPLHARTLLDRSRTDWFPKFLSNGQMAWVFQPVVDLRAATVFGRQALVRGKMGRSEIRGSELVEAAQAHDALFSFDSRARVAALEAGLPSLPEGEVLFVRLDPRGALDLDSSLRSVWPVVERLGGGDGVVGLELVGAERYPDLPMLERLVAVHREQGAVIAVDELSAGATSLAMLERLRPDLAKLDAVLLKDLEASPPRRRLVGSLVEVAHEIGVRVVADGIERDSQLEALAELDVDFGLGSYLGQPTEEMLPVDARLLSRAAV